MCYMNLRLTLTPTLTKKEKLENSTSQVTAINTGHLLKGLVQNEKTTLQS